LSRQRLGQNFLLDPSILRRIVAASGAGPGDTVVEIGPGLGRLTSLIAETAGRVIAIELDTKLHERLSAEMAGVPNMEIVHGDALKYPYGELGPFRVIANIPYYITTPIIFRLLEHRDRLLSMTLTVQKEVARRITAPPGGKDYGVLSLSIQYRGRAEMKFIVPAGAFSPKPKVDSACVHIDVYRTPPVDVTDEALFMKVIRTAFSQRRKTLTNSLKTVSPDIRATLEHAGIDASERPERLSMEDFARLANSIAAQG